MQLESGLGGLRILVVDDEDVNLLLVRRTLERAGYERVVTAKDPTAVPGLFLETEPDLVLLDLHMPGMDGIELMTRLGPFAGGRTGVPFLVLTADASEKVRHRALEAGARDFLTKPFSASELLLRVRNLLEVQQLHRQLREQNASLEQQVVRRTGELERARLEILERLALAAEYRDDATQQHARRIGRTARVLSSAVGLDDEQAHLIGRAAPLHDIGKIGVPDAILLKPGRLTEAEFAAMKTHTTIGAGILSGGTSALLRMAERIALTHHERWDGRGYPGGLYGTDVPLAGRIAAIADVFDALTHERPYKQAWPVASAVAEMLSQRGHQFDPDLLDAFATLDHDVLVTRFDDEPPGFGDVVSAVQVSTTETGSSREAMW